jgi:hypothetical protein
VLRNSRGVAVSTDFRAEFRLNAKTRIALNSAALHPVNLNDEQAEHLDGN